MSGELSLPPGPRTPRLIQVRRYTFDLPGFFAESRARYGSTWTMRLLGFPPAVLTSDRDSIRRLLTGDPLSKRHGNDLLEPLMGRNSLLLLEPAEHLARRKLEGPPFHGERIRVYSDRIQGLLEREVASWVAGSEIDVHPRAQQVTLEVILELVLGIRDPGLRDRLSNIFETLSGPISTLGMFLPASLGRRSAWNPLSRSFWSLMDRLHCLLGEHIAATRADPRLGERTDVLALLVSATDEGGVGLRDEQLRDELVTLVSAGHETTATAIAWAAELLAHNPQVSARLRETLQSGERDYLRAAAKEVLRIRTVAPVSAARHALQPIEIGGHLCGPEPVLLVSAWDLHRDPDLFPDPDLFRPERFIEEPPDGYAYLPFGGGVHRCLGASLATLELELALETLAMRCELAPVGPPSRPVRRGPTLAPANRGRVRVQRKLSPLGASVLRQLASGL